MNFFLETLIGGLLAGTLYSLVAIGFVLIYKASGVFNFAQGAMLLFAALTFVSLHEQGVPFALAIALTLLVMIIGALLIERQCWFCATDLGRLIGQPHLDERAARTLDADQLIDAVVLNTHGQPETTRLISESGVYVALLHYYHPENRCLRQWLTHEVIPLLRDQYQSCDAAPRRRLLQWQALELDGSETFTLEGIAAGLAPRQQLTLQIERADGSRQSVPLLCRIDTPIEIEYYRHGGILPYVLRGILGGT